MFCVSLVLFLPVFCFSYKSYFSLFLCFSCPIYLFLVFFLSYFSLFLCSSCPISPCSCVFLVPPSSVRFSYTLLPFSPSHRPISFNSIFLFHFFSSSPHDR